MQTAQLIQEEHAQIVRLPENIHIEGQRVQIKTIGNVVVLIPEHNPWQIFFDSLNQFTDDFMADRDQPGWQERVLQDG